MSTYGQYQVPNEPKPSVGFEHYGRPQFAAPPPPPPPPPRPPTAGMPDDWGPPDPSRRYVPVPTMGNIMAAASQPAPPMGQYMAANFTADDLRRHPVNGEFLGGSEHLFDLGNAQGISGLGRRAAVWLIDLAFAYLVGLAMAFMFSQVGIYATTPDRMFVVVWILNRFVLTQIDGASVGHFIMRSRVFVPYILRDGTLMSTKAGPARLFIRDVVLLADVLTLGTVMLFTRARRAMGDRVTGVWVIRHDPSIELGRKPDDPSARRYWMPLFLTTKIETDRSKIRRNTERFEQQRERERQEHLRRVTEVYYRQGGQGPMPPTDIVLLDDPNSIVRIAQDAINKLPSEQKAKLDKEQSHTLNPPGSV